jgi:hypothetical protein
MSSTDHTASAPSTASETDRRRDKFEEYREECIYRITSDRSLNASQVRVGVVLAMHLNRKTGDAYPGERRLARLTGLDRRHLKRALDGRDGKPSELLRHVEVAPPGQLGRGRMTRYRFKENAPDGAHIDDPENAPDGAHIDPANAPAWDTENAPAGDGKCARLGQKMRPEGRLTSETTDKTAEKRTAEGRRRAKAIPLPSVFQLTDAMILFGEKKGWRRPRCESEFERFTAHHQAKGSRIADWSAAWRTWVMNGVKFDAQDKAKAKTGRSSMVANLLRGIDE